MRKNIYCFFVVMMLLSYQSIGSDIKAKGGKEKYPLETWRKVQLPSESNEKERLSWKQEVGTSDVLWDVYLGNGGGVVASPYYKKKIEKSSPCVNFHYPKKYKDKASRKEDLGWPSYYGKVTEYYKVHNGWIVGFYNRFNGEVWWCSDSRDVSYKVSDSKMVGLVKGIEESQVYIIDGTFDDKSPLTGKVDYVVNNKKGVWKKKDDIRFPSKLSMGRKLGDKLYFIGDNGSLYVLKEGQSITTKIGHREWHVVHPKSIIKVNDHIYVGARKYVSRIDLTSWEITYFSPK